MDKKELKPATLPESVSAKFEFENKPGTDRVLVGKPINREVVFSRISLSQAEELEKAGKYLKKRETIEKAAKK